MAEDVLPGTGTEDGAGDSDNTGLIAAGVAALEAGRRDEAESAFRKVLAREPDNPSALRRLGAVVYMKSDYEDARGLLDMAIDLAPEDADAYNNLAAILLDRGELTDAEINFRRARELDPADTDINFNLGLILLQRGNFVAARSCFEVVVAGRPDDADAHHNLGMAWRRGSGKDAAAAAIAKLSRVWRPVTFAEHQPGGATSRSGLSTSPPARAANHSVHPSPRGMTAQSPSV